MSIIVGTSAKKSLNNADETFFYGVFICLFSCNLLIIRAIYPWMNKPVMHSFRRTAAMLKLFEKPNGPSRSLDGVRTEILALTFYAVSQITVKNSVNPRHMKQIGKACQTN